MLEGWGRFVHRRRWAVLGASLAMLALSGVLLAQGGDLGNPDTIPSTESGRASQLLSTELPRPTGGEVQSRTGGGCGQYARFCSSGAEKRY